MSKETEIRYQEVDINEVIRWFAKDFTKSPDGFVITRWEAFLAINPSQINSDHKVIFKLFVEKEKSE